MFLVTEWFFTKIDPNDFGAWDFSLLLDGANNLAITFLSTNQANVVDTGQSRLSDRKQIQTDNMAEIRGLSQ